MTRYHTMAWNSEGQPSSPSHRSTSLIFPVVVALVILLFYVHEYQSDANGHSRSNVSPRIRKPSKLRSRIHRPQSFQDGAKDCHILHNSNSCNTLPNYFMYSSYRKYHKDAFINFMHIPKCGGTTMKECMKSVARNLTIARPFLLHTDGRLQLTQGIFNGNYSILNRTSLFMGDYSFGFCDLIHDKIGDRKCSTFIILRDPYDRLVSNYYFCIELNLSTPGIPDCRTTPITEWSLSKKSTLWNEFFTDIDCTRTDKWHCVIDYQPITEAYVLSRNKSYVQVVVANLEKHFSLIGLTEDLPSTMKMLQVIYKLPFFDICKDVEYNVGGYASSAHINKTKLKENTKSALLRSEEVREMLYPELQIYNRAKEIFEIEKAKLDQL